MALEGRPLGFDPDGNARWLVRVHFTTSQRTATRLLRGGNLDYFASAGRAQWQTRARFGAPSAIVTTSRDGPIAVRVHSTGLGTLRDARARTDTRFWPMSRVVAKALGPRLVQMGWFPPESVHTVRILRSGSDGGHVVGLVAPPSSTYRDATVHPGRTYRYSIIRNGAGSARFLVHVPADVQWNGRLATVGKGVWLSFSPSVLDPDAYTALDPAAIVQQAADAGLRYIELRMAYGEYWEVTADAKPTIDRLIDLAAARGIAVIGCTVPRQASFEDLRQSIDAAMYRTQAGTRVAGLGLDLERGEEFLGAGPAAYAALADYPRLVREALGPSVHITSIVEDPFLERLRNRDVPYRSMAANSDVLQPMAYWRMLTRGRMNVSRMNRVIQASADTVRRLTASDIPINLGAQMVPLAGKAGPPPEEVSAAIEASRHAGAVGIAFFQWSGTTKEQWKAIGDQRW